MIKSKEKQARQNWHSMDADKVLEALCKLPQTSAI